MAKSSLARTAMFVTEHRKWQTEKDSSPNIPTL